MEKKNKVDDKELRDKIVKLEDSMSDLSGIEEKWTKF